MQRKSPTYLNRILDIINNFSKESIDVTDEVIEISKSLNKTFQTALLQEVHDAMNGEEIVNIQPNLEIYCRLLAALWPQNTNELLDQSIAQSLKELVRRNQTVGDQSEVNNLYLGLPYSYLIKDNSAVFIQIAKRNLDTKHDLGRRLAAFRLFYAYIQNTQDAELKTRLIGHLSQYADDKEQAICNAVREALMELILNGTPLSATAFVSTCITNGLTTLQTKTQRSTTPAEESAWFGLPNEENPPASNVAKVNARECYETFKRLHSNVTNLEMRIDTELDEEIDCPLSLYLKLAEKAFHGNADAIVTTFFPLAAAEEDWLARKLVEHFIDKASFGVQEDCLRQLRKKNNSSLNPLLAAFGALLTTTEVTTLYRDAAFEAKKSTVHNDDNFNRQLKALGCLGHLGAKVDAKLHDKLSPHFRDDCVRTILDCVKVGTKDDEKMTLNETACAALIKIMRRPNKVGLFNILSQCLTFQLGHLETKTAELVVKSPEKQDKARLKLFGLPRKGVVDSKSEDLKSCLVM